MDDGYIIRNAAGEDRTSSFTKISKVDGALSISPKPVTVTARSEEFTYDGTAHSNDGFDVDGLVGSDEVTAEVAGSVTFPSEGAVTNELRSYGFASGTAGNYAVAAADGELRVEDAGAAITITAASASKVYDGTVLTKNEVTVTDGRLFEGDRLVATATGSATGVADTHEGNNPVADGYKIMHGDVDVTANYNITAVAGTLTVEPRTVTVRAEGKSKASGEPDPALTYSVDGLVGDDVLTGALSRAAGEDAGTYEITQGTLAAGDNYRVAYEGNALTVNPRLIVHHVFADDTGKQAAPDYSVVLAVGDPYTVDLPVVDGYRPVDRNGTVISGLEGTMVAKDLEVTVRYVADVVPDASSGTTPAATQAAGQADGTAGTASDTTPAAGANGDGTSGGTASTDTSGGGASGGTPGGVSGGAPSSASGGGASTSAPGGASGGASASAPGSGATTGAGATSVGPGGTTSVGPRAAINIGDDGIPQVEAIEDDGNALASGGAWSLFDVLATLLAAVLSGVMLFGAFGKRRREDEDDDGDGGSTVGTGEDQRSESDEVIKRKRILRFASLLPAIVAIIVLLLTQDFAQPMAVFDRWSLLFGILAIAQVVLLLLSRKKTRTDENEDG